MSDSPVSSGTPSAAPAVAATITTNTNSSTGVADAANQVAQQASPTEQKKAPTEQDIKQAVKEWKLKSNGKTRTVTDQAELIRLAQLGLGANEKFAQAAENRKKAEAIIDLFQKDPAKAMKALGHDVRKLAEDYLYNEAQKHMMTPEQKQKAEIMEEIQRLKAEAEDLKKNQQDERISQLQAKYEVDIQTDIIGAIDKYKLPKNPKTVARMAEYMASALENGYELTAQDIAPRVRMDLEEEHKSLFNHYDVEDLLKLLGNDQLKKIRDYEINKVKSKSPAAPTQTVQTPVSNKDNYDEAPKKKFTWEEFERDELSKYKK